MKSKSWAFVLAFLLLLSSVAFGIKPLKSLQVSCQNKVYQCYDCNTVEDVLNQIQQKSGITRDDVKAGKVLYKGKILENRDILRQVGVTDGSLVLVVTGNYKMQGMDYLSLFLSLMSEDGWERFYRKIQEENGSLANFLVELKEATYLTREDIANFLRNGLDLTYHALRASWENPNFRSSLSDPQRIEAYRKVVSLHLSKKILSDIGAKKIVESPEKWHRLISRFTSSVIRTGDVILDGVLDLLLDVLKGAGKTAAAENTHKRANYSADKAPNTMEDPYLANNLLFELSESESED